jgi:hypothetical protein
MRRWWIISIIVIVNAVGIATGCRPDDIEVRIRVPI